MGRTYCQELFLLVAYATATVALPTSTSKSEVSGDADDAPEKVEGQNILWTLIPLMLACCTHPIAGNLKFDFRYRRILNVFPLVCAWDALTFIFTVYFPNDNESFIETLEREIRERHFELQSVKRYTFGSEFNKEEGLSIQKISLAWSDVRLRIVTTVIYVAMYAKLFAYKGIPISFAICSLYMGAWVVLEIPYILVTVAHLRKSSNTTGRLEILVGKPGYLSPTPSNRMQRTLGPEYRNLKDYSPETKLYRFIVFLLLFIPFIFIQIPFENAGFFTTPLWYSLWWLKLIEPALMWAVYAPLGLIPKIWSFYDIFPMTNRSHFLGFIEGIIIVVALPFLLIASLLVLIMHYALFCIVSLYLPMFLFFVFNVLPIMLICKALRKISKRIGPKGKLFLARLIVLGLLAGTIAYYLRFFDGSQTSKVKWTEIFP